MGKIVVDLRADVRGPQVQEAVDRLWIVTWNVKVGEGDVVRLLGDVRQHIHERGGNPDHLIVLLQEAYTRKNGVQEHAPPEALYPSRRIGGDANRETPSDVVDVADALGMTVVYVPSMLNGKPGGGVPEDRGNAILSGLRPDSALVIELPFESQRRAAVAGQWSGRTRAGTPWRLRVVSSHLDLHARGWRLWGLLRTSGRNRQARGLAQALEGSIPTVVAGDFNTVLSRTEPAVGILHRAFPRPDPHPSRPTLKIGPFGVLDFQLDRMFFRVPDDWHLSHERLSDRYGSDHYPLLGWVQF